MGSSPYIRPLAELQDEYEDFAVAVVDNTAAQEARVEVALIDREAELTGTQCRACEHAVYGTPDTCQRCGSSDVFEVDYVNELVETLARTGAEADFVDPFEALSEVGGVGALLRY
jgi:peptide subunit release factor 1 (eRF1)